MNDCIVSYADIYYTFEVIKDLVNCPDDIAISYDPNWLELWSKRFENPLDDAETFKINKGGYLIEIGQKPKKNIFITFFTILIGTASYNLE